MDTEVLVCVGCGRKYGDPSLAEIVESPCCGRSIVEEYTEDRIARLLAADQFSPEDRERYADLLND